MRLDPCLRHLCSTKLPNHLYLGDKDSPKSAQITEDAGLKEQPVLGVFSLDENGCFCLHMNLQPGGVKPGIGIWFGEYRLDLEASGSISAGQK